MKTYILNTEKRKTLVTRIAELTGVNLRYMGAPTYSYENDRYIVARDGSLQVKEGEEEIIGVLLSEGMKQMGIFGSPHCCVHGCLPVNNHESRMLWLEKFGSPNII